MRMKKLADTGEKRMLWRRIIIYAIAFFILGILQCAFFSRLKPFGATPDLLLGGICAVMLLDDKKAAAVCAVGAGYFIDALGAVPPSFSPLFYLLCVASVGMVTDKLMPGLASFLLSVLPAALLGAVRTYVSMWVSFSALPPLTGVWTVLLRELAATVLFCIPVYFVIKLCTVPIDAKGRFST